MAKENMMDMMFRDTEVMSEAITMCRREYELYPCPEIWDLVVKVYVSSFRYLTEMSQWFGTPTSRDRLRLISKAKWDISSSAVMGELRQTSEAVIKEVEYQHRSEMRDATNRLKGIEQDQQKILAAMETQRKILTSLQEEREVMTEIQDQQKILHLLQQVETKLNQLSTRDDRGIHLPLQQSSADTN